MNTLTEENNKKLIEVLRTVSFKKYQVSETALSRIAPHNLRKQFFQKKLLDIFGISKYDITKIVYTNSKEKVGVFCDNCQDYFWTLPHNLRAGKGCPICRAKERNKP